VLIWRVAGVSGLTADTTPPAIAFKFTANHSPRHRH
jgi:hypothetical protein